MHKFNKEEILDMLIGQEHCFEEFVDGKSIEEMCVYEKLIYSKVTKDNIEI